MARKDSFPVLPISIVQIEIFFQFGIASVLSKAVKPAPGMECPFLARTPYFASIPASTKRLNLVLELVKHRLPCEKLGKIISPCMNSWL